jgi:UDP-N-acetylglucosamine 4,6-dehydratase
MAATLEFLRGRSVLITGGTGSFGKAFVKAALQHGQPRRLVIFSRDELKQVEMEQEVSPLDRSGSLRFFIGDVRDTRRLAMALREIDIVVHAAAMKQVPVAEYNPFECIHTNVLGAENIVQASLDAGVERVIALSTDKAASPLNLYGASKLAAEKIFVAANHLSGSKGTRFSVVRYGNVLGSRGSVLPIFRKLVANGTDHLPITDVRMTRFWITLEEGVAFVLNSVREMQGGEIFVPKISSMKIVELAKAIGPKLELRAIGIRPGEKLHETLITEDEARNTIDCGDHYVIKPAISYWKGPSGDIPGKSVPEGFSYTSDNNDQWISGEALVKMINDNRV